MALVATTPSIVDVTLTKEEVCSTVSNDLGAEENKLEVYPNPTEGYVTISLNEKFTYSLLNLNGQVVKTGAGSNLVSVDLHDVAPGVYSIKIEAADQLIVKKLNNNSLKVTLAPSLVNLKFRNYFKEDC